VAVIHTHTHEITPLGARDMLTVKSRSVSI
jgi:hypothetical protein